MMFDDHDIRDDWNTSWSWRRDIRATTWWQERIVAGLSAYWVHQHIGNLSPRRARRRRRSGSGCAAHAASGDAGELDLTAAPRRAGDPRRRRAVDRTGGATPAPSATAPSSSSTRVRRATCGPTAARCSTPSELRWLDGALHGDVRHLFVGTSLPFLLPPGPARLRGDERGDGPGGVRPDGSRRPPSELRRTIDLEHWAAFNEGFDEVFEHGHGGRARRARPGPGHGDLPVRRRAQLLPRRGHRPAARHGASLAGGPGRVLADPQPDAARRACRHVAVREVARAADAVHRVPLASTCPTRPTRGRSPTGRGSTTTSRS